MRRLQRFEAFPHEIGLFLSYPPEDVRRFIEHKGHESKCEGCWKVYFCQSNGQPYEPRTYQDLFKRCVRQAGIRGANFHALRHTFATRSLEQGMDIVTLSRLLGHANPSITMDKYGHALDDHKRSSIDTDT